MPGPGNGFFPPACHPVGMQSHWVPASLQPPLPFQIPVPGMLSSPVSPSGPFLSGHPYQARLAWEG